MRYEPQTPPRLTDLGRQSIRDSEENEMRTGASTAEE